jgi:hypothetical protein
MPLTIRPIPPRRPKTEKEIEEIQKEVFAHNTDNEKSNDNQ